LEGPLVLNPRVAIREEIELTLEEFSGHGTDGRALSQ